MADTERVRQILTETQALLTNDHVVLTSKRHSETYLNKDAIYPHTRAISELCWMMARDYRDAGIQAVVAPALGGIVLSQWTAFHLSRFTGKDVLGTYAEKDENGHFVLRRGYEDMVRGKRVLLVEDILTTGGSVKQVLQVVQALDTEIVGVAAICNRGGVRAEDIGNIPTLRTLITIDMKDYEQPYCPMCTLGVPINTAVGKGKEYLASLH